MHLFVHFLEIKAENAEDHDIADRDSETYTFVPLVTELFFLANMTLFKQHLTKDYEYHIAVLLQSTTTCFNFGVYDKKDGAVCQFNKPCLRMENESVNNTCYFKCSCQQDICNYMMLNTNSFPLDVCEIYLGVYK